MFKKLLFILIVFPIIATAQLKINGTFNPSEGYTFGILYKIATDNVFYQADSAIAADGSFQLTLQQPLAPGMYRIVYNLPQDQYFFDFLYNGKEDLEFSFSNESGAQFTTSSENEIWTNFKEQRQQFETTITTLLAAEEVSKKEVKKTLKAQKEWYETIFENSKGMLANEFIKASKPYLTDDFTTTEDYKTKAKEAYFATTDFSNPLLQKSAFLLEHSLLYLFNFRDDDAKTASYKQGTDDVVKALSNATASYQKTLLANIWNFMVANELTEVANHLGEKHLLPLAKQENDNALAQRITVYKNTSIGNKAPNFSWQNEEDDTPSSFYNLKENGSQKYVLVFWSAHCSHCLAEIPALHKHIETLEEGAVTVVAVGLEEEPYEWKNKTYDLPKFVNVLGMGKWENEIGNMYDVSATPTYFVLDENFVITAKPETLDEVKKLLKVVK